ncbi:translation elongation factor Ts [Nevskia sp.]|uniref:translation elongation factor Ts n=1 Tax=Nevskia sp. TaxID=1929292 RepID=UPI0025EE7E53|nr:translation elongation factor Ts [Nevskia sp.]
MSTPVTAALVKELRDRTGAGMSDCKKALEATGGNVDAAAEKLRVDGMAKADKKGSRTAAEGVISIAVGADAIALVETNSETDFVSKGDDFKALGEAAAKAALAARPATMAELLALKNDAGQTIEEMRRAMVATIGENITVRRFDVVAKAGGAISYYMHGTKIGVVVALNAGDEELARDIAMHVAASAPRYLDTTQIPAEAIEAEKRVIEATMAQEQAEAQADSDRFGGFLKEMDAERTNGHYDGLDAEGKKAWDDEYVGVKKKFGGGYRAKPAEILAKMTAGKIAKFVNDITLVGQPFVKDPDQTVEKLLKSKNASVAAFVRLAVGEGIEKKATDFAAEVAAATQI